MNYNRKKIKAAHGFTLIEVLVVIAIMVALMALSVPSYLEWKKNLEYRQAAREVMSLLRNARSRAIATNSNQQVVVDPAQHRVGTNTYGPLTWTVFPCSISTGTTTTFQFVPNGTVSSATSTVNIQDRNGSTRFQVIVLNTGRISIQKP